MHIEEKIKRGGSVFHRKPNSSTVAIHADDKVAVNSSVHGPVIPTYELKGKPSASHLNLYNKEELVSSEATPSMNKPDNGEEDIGVEELHFQKVRFQQRCKKMVTE